MVVQIKKNYFEMTQKLFRKLKIKIIIKCQLILL